MINMKFEMTFKTVNTDNPVVKNYDYHPLYNELRNTFDSFLGSPVDIVDEKYTEKHIDFEGKEIKFDMIKHTLTYSVSLNEVAHLNSMVKLLENLDLDCDFLITD